ncbi:MAG: alpha/beta hydrolase [Bacteroidales bacterium]|jgi:pimeloyl-ACP methyl ester carboxylesterase|nr:alpha/beta hydrolase [Bacteroidales bacterium]
MKIFINILVISLLVILGFFVLLFVILYLYSPGKITQFSGPDGKPLAGSISEKTFVSIGGVKQGMFIRSKNIQNPVLLYVHGGPAFPNYFLFDRYEPGLEDYFTVCYWEQRGGGLSYHKDIPLETMTFEQFTSDAIELTKYLRKRFNKEKIYIMAHSGGTPFALEAVAKAPQLYEAYIGMAQITRQAESEKRAYNYILEQYSVAGNTKALSELKKYAPPTDSLSFAAFFKSMLRDNAMHELGIGTMRNMRSVFTGVFIPVWTCKAYTLKEKFNIWISKLKFVKKAKFVEELFVLDIPASIPKVEIPVYFFSGQYDLTVNIDLSKDYLNEIQAPVKGFYTFRNSAHSPLFEEPEKVRQIIENDVLKKKTNLADQ